MGYYIEQSDGLLELRQERFRQQRRGFGGNGHPHDVCAFARTADEMRSMIAKHFNASTIDWSAVENKGEDRE